MEGGEGKILMYTQRVYEIGKSLTLARKTTHELGSSMKPPPPQTFLILYKCVMGKKWTRGKRALQSQFSFGAKTLRLRPAATSARPVEK